MAKKQNPDENKTTFTGVLVGFMRVIAGVTVCLRCNLEAIVRTHCVRYNFVFNFTNQGDVPLYGQWTLLSYRFQKCSLGKYLTQF